MVALGRAFSRTPRSSSAERHAERSQRGRWRSRVVRQRFSQIHCRENLTAYAIGVCFCVCILLKPRFSRGKSLRSLMTGITGSCRSLWHSNPRRATSSGEAAGCERFAGRFADAAKAAESGSFTIWWTKGKSTFSLPMRKTNRRISIAASYGFSATW